MKKNCKTTKTETKENSRPAVNDAEKNCIPAVNETTEICEPEKSKPKKNKPKKSWKPTKPQMKTFGMDLLFDIIGSILYGLGMYTFAAHANFAPGGVTGLAILVNHLIPQLPIGFCSVLLNIPIVIICYKTLGKMFFVRSVKTILISALFMDVLLPLIPVYEGEQMLAAIFGGILAGAGLTFIYARDSSTGGTDFVIMAIRKRHPHLSIGNISMVVDGIIILLGYFVYGNSINAVLYGIIMDICYSVLIDKLMYGMDARKLAIIISSEGKAIADRIGTEVGRGVTVTNGYGAYTGNERQILLCTCSNAEIFKLKRIVYAVDNKAFVTINSVDAAYGEGFKAYDK